MDVIHIHAFPLFWVLVAIVGIVVVGIVIWAMAAGQS